MKLIPVRTNAIFMNSSEEHGSIVLPHMFPTSHSPPNRALQTLAALSPYHQAQNPVCVPAFHRHGYRRSNLPCCLTSNLFWQTIEWWDKAQNHRKIYWITKMMLYTLLVMCDVPLCCSPSTRDNMSLVVSGFVPQIPQSLDCRVVSGIDLVIPLRAKILTSGMVSRRDWRE